MWYECKFLDSNYSVNELGEIRSNERIGTDGRKVYSRIIKPYEINTGYLIVDLRHKGKTKRFLLHRLVYCTINNIDINTKKVIHHIDHNRKNNTISNLAMITQSENITEYVNSEYYKPQSIEHRKHLAKLARDRFKKKIVQIDLTTHEIIKEYDALTDVKRELGFDMTAISRVCLGKQKTAYGYMWKYVNDINN